MQLEVVIGFTAGYVVGTRHGREGLQRVMDAARDIWASPEARRLVGDGLATVQSAAEAAPVGDILSRLGGGRREVLRSVLDEVVERRFGRQSMAA